MKISDYYMGLIGLVILWAALMIPSRGQDPAQTNSVSPLLVLEESHMLRIDLNWPGQQNHPAYEVQRAEMMEGPWITLPNPTPRFHRFSDFIGQAGQSYYYRVRLKPDPLAPPSGNQPSSWVNSEGGWSSPVLGETLVFDRNKLAEDVQEAAVHFYFDEADPNSGMSPEASPFFDRISAVGATGMGMANIIVGVEHGFVSRQEGLDLALRILHFLDTKAEQRDGVYGHWIDSKNGKTVPFGEGGLGPDLVETAFLVQGVILLREYFQGNSADEIELREIAERITSRVQWDQFVQNLPTGPVLPWIGPDNTSTSKLIIRGPNEAMMPYILGIGSARHPLPPKSFYTGWMDPNNGLGIPGEQFGIKYQFGNNFGWPLLFAHYSFIGFDPKQIFYKGKSYYAHFVDQCQIQHRYALSRASEFKGYDTLWGQTASLYPGGYRENAPGPGDDGTIATTAALSSMPYVPEEATSCMESMYVTYGTKLWGAYGFYNAINPTRDWVAHCYIGIELGPIAPMIENSRTGLFWRLFMKSPEAQRACQRIESACVPITATSNETLHPN